MVHNTHPLQTRTWGEFREQTGVKVVFGSDFVMTLHRVPKTQFTIGYIPKGKLPTKPFIHELQKVGKENNCIFIQLEPNVTIDTTILRDKDIENKDAHNIFLSQYPDIHPAAHPLFTKYTFMLDLAQSEETLLKNMHPKTRYNIRVAEKKGVVVTEDNSEKAFETFLRLNHETNTRQKFYSHPDSYFWKLRRIASKSESDFSFHLMTATYDKTILTSWVLFICGDTLYYPYGASSSEHREVMSNNLMMWEVIRFGKSLGLKQFDMWGSLGPNPDTKDPWFGFHRFKQGYGGALTEFVGSYDLVLNTPLYQGYKVADKLRWMWLKLRK